MNFATVEVRDRDGELWVENSGLRLKVPGQNAGGLRAYNGKQVTLGVRPEDLTVANSADPADHCFDAAVDVVEQLGSEILLSVSAGQDVLVAAVEPTLKAKVHEKLRLAVNPERMHFFDAKTEAAI